ncbi:MAG: ATP-binding protein, partial [Acidimicrobiia bacterium]
GLARAGLAVLALDLQRLDPGDNTAEIARIAAREARLIGAGLVAGPVEAVAERGPTAVKSLAEAGCPVVLVGKRTWDPNWSRDVPLLLEAPLLALAERASVWAGTLNGDSPPENDPAAAMVPFRLTPEQVERAGRAARLWALAEDRAVTTRDLQAGARAQNAAGLERLARRIEPRAGWEDLILPPSVFTQLLGLAGRARNRDLVLDTWGMGDRSSKGRAVTALFAGDSGTGKTMSAEVVAGALGLDLYVIDLSSVIDKYIGETEKNLDRIFSEADRINGVLLFDEADAIFGKRSDVKDAHDRYANVEVAYLLQRMELFDGLAILTTNLRANVDEAFTRRLDAIIGFPLPEEDDRRRLWAIHLRPGLPLAGDIDLDFLAGAFKLSGGSIRNIALTAAYLAAAAGRPVEMADLIHGTSAEYHKLGHLCMEAEFGPWFPLLAAEAALS